MRPVRYIAVLALVLFVWQSPVFAALASTANEENPVSLSVLEEQARSRVNAKARVPLAEESSELFKGVDGFEAPESGHVPNYLRALSTMPGVPNAFAHTAKTILYGGTIEPEIKLEMGLRMAQMHGSPYVAAHMERLLHATERGQAILALFHSGSFDSMKPADRLALNYAEGLTRGVHGVSDADFEKVRGYFNDSQLVEMTMTVCFFNYFDRFSEALNLPVESWVFDTPAKLHVATFDPPVARVALISDAEIKATDDMVETMTGPKSPAKGWGIGFANSLRALMRCPDIAQAWMSYGTAVRQSAVIPRDLQLQVSFAVSMANGCRYCTFHQVLGLRKLGVSMTKLMEMEKDDGALTPHELVAVLFARKLARDPASMTDADYQKLRAEFGDQGALDVLLQTCMFSGFNRFTDGLRLPSEDVAVQTYKEVYGKEWKPREKN